MHTHPCVLGGNFPKQRPSGNNLRPRNGQQKKCQRPLDSLKECKQVCLDSTQSTLLRFPGVDCPCFEECFVTLAWKLKMDKEKRNEIKAS